MTQRVVIPKIVRQTLISEARRMLTEESQELREIQSELEAAISKKTRTVGWKGQEARSRRRVEIYTEILTVLETGNFVPPPDFNCPRVILQETVERVGLLVAGRSLVESVYRRIKDVLNIWSY